MKRLPTKGNILSYSAITDSGLKYSHNEDFYLLPEIETRDDASSQSMKLFLLCDGMGGENAGEVASQMCCRWIYDDFYSGVANDHELENIIVRTNSRLYELSIKHSIYNGMGTTLVAALFEKRKSSFYTVGDSRVYRYRNNCLEQLSEDHSEVWELYKLGQISKDRIRFHPRKNLITCAMGNDVDFMKENINHVSSELEIGDLYLLCSDGLSDMVSDEEIASVLKKKSSPKRASEALVKRANKNGGKDNVTVILIKI